MRHTRHSLATEMNLVSSKAIVANPYDYGEKLALNKFPSYTSFDAYEIMLLHLKLTFAFDTFVKNAVLISSEYGRRDDENREVVRELR